MWPERVNHTGKEESAAASDGALGAGVPDCDTAQPFRLDRTAALIGRPAMVTVSGEIDFDCATDFHQAVLTALPNTATGLDLDLSAVSFCDCALLNALLSVRGQVMATGRTLTVSSCSAVVARLLDLTDSRDAFPEPAARPLQERGPGGAPTARVGRPHLPVGDGLNDAVADVAGCLAPAPTPWRYWTR